MLKTRVIPCLLLKGNGLVKTVKFGNERYIGDPINAVKIFNDKEADELIFLDIMATEENKRPPFDLLKRISTESFMPLSYGGGVRSLEDIKEIFKIGVEKVSINTQAIENPDFIKEASEHFGSQSIIASFDVKKTGGGYKVFKKRGREETEIDPVSFAVKMQKKGAGEIFLNSIDRDGTMEGYDQEIIRKVSEAVNVPVVACGGASGIEDFRKAVDVGASAVSAGSLFVFIGPSRAVLINYPSSEELEEKL